MRVLLGQLTPVVARPVENLRRIDAALEGWSGELAVFPELFLSGYRPGDRIHELALREGDSAGAELRAIARRHHTAVALGTPVGSTERAGEVHNAVLLVRPDGSVDLQVKRYLPSYGPFEEGHFFTPTDRSAPLALGARRVGFAICYDTFFPEVFRSLTLAGAELLVIVSASPVTSRKLFDRLLPARAIENGCPVLYVNRVGVEDSVVFGGGSGGWDVRGDPIPFAARPAPDGAPEETILEGEVDLGEAARWRPFRPVLRDLASRPGTG